jgi:hypothetical protein
MATTDEAAAAKATLPRGWGRFGKAIDRIVETAESDEPLLGVLVAINPSLKQDPLLISPIAGGIISAMKTTNVVLGATDRRIIVVSTGLTGGPRETTRIDYAGLTITEGAKDTSFAMAWPGVQVTFKGAAKTQLPAFIETVAAQATPPTPD